jgi:protein-tyrosine phosphatase
MREKLTSRLPVKVLFVCMGNICRSPTAEAVFRHHVEQAGLAHAVIADSAGTHDYHIGAAPDPRAQRAAARRGYDLSALRARQILVRDYVEFDLVLAMDDINMKALRRSCPAEHRHKVQLLGAYCVGAAKGCAVPDPYYGETEDFERVLDLAEDAAQSLLRHIRETFLGR